MRSRIALAALLGYGLLWLRHAAAAQGNSEGGRIHDADFLFAMVAILLAAKLGSGLFERWQDLMVPVFGRSRHGEGNPDRRTPWLEYLKAAVYGLALAGLVGLLDYWTGPEWGFSIFYLIPVLLSTHLAGRSAGLLVSLASAAFWMLADFLSRPSYVHPLVPYWNATVRLGFFVGATLMLARLQSALEREQALARHDALTGLLNAASFFEAVQRELERSRRYGHSLTLVYLDCDNFKAVNDTHGHPVGDQLLRVVAETLRAQSRSTDTLARLGGDEFACLYPETRSQEAVTAVEKVRRALLGRMGQHGWPVTFSFGVVTTQAYPGTPAGLIKSADQAMYVAKKAGKNRVHAVS